MSVAPTSPSKSKPEPFLQWVGGKRKIASQPTLDAELIKKAAYQ